MRARRNLALGILVLATSALAARVQDPLPSWNDGAAKKAIVDFVKATTTAGSPLFVPPQERVATFDQDGTLWVEQPIYSQFVYCFDRVPDVVKARPKLATTTLSGMPVDDFRAEVLRWLASARDGRWKRPYTDLTYLPMQEVLQYLRANGYKT